MPIWQINIQAPQVMQYCLREVTDRHLTHILKEKKKPATVMAMVKTKCMTSLQFL